MHSYDPGRFDQLGGFEGVFDATPQTAEVGVERGLGFLVLREQETGDKVDLLALSREKLATLRIGLYDKSPASQWLARHDLVDRGVPYRIMNADPAQYPGQIIERDLEQGKIDAAIVWGPIAGYFARRAHSPELAVVPSPLYS